MMCCLMYFVANCHLLHVLVLMQWNPRIRNSFCTWVLQQNILPLYNVAGYACRTYLSKHYNWKGSYKLLQGRAQLQEQPADEMVFIHSNAYAASNGDCSGLYVPCVQFVHCITNCEDMVSSRFMDMFHMSKVCDRLVNAILNSVELTWCTVPGCSTPTHLSLFGHMLRCAYFMQVSSSIND